MGLQPRGQISWQRRLITWYPSLSLTVILNHSTNKSSIALSYKLMFILRITKRKFYFNTFVVNYITLFVSNTINFSLITVLYYVWLNTKNNWNKFNISLLVIILFLKKINSILPAPSEKIFLSENRNLKNL